MTTATFDRRTASIQSLANALHLMDRRFGSTHTPADYMAEAAERVDRAAANSLAGVRPFEPGFPRDNRADINEWAADYRSAAL
jgi:hypothetical protein